MPRTRNSKRLATAIAQPEPTDIIDLTQDSPCNRALRLSRNRTDLESSEDVEPVVLPVLPINDTDDVSPRRKKLQKPAVIINLDETINLDDTANNSIASKQIQGSPEWRNNKQGLTCPVCLESLADENIKAMTTPCGHVFCVECLKKITQQKKKCSLCQRTISISKCIVLHI